VPGQRAPGSLTTCWHCSQLSLRGDVFKKVKEIYDNYYKNEPHGKAFPINKWSHIPEMEKVLRKSHWHGEIDLNNQELLTYYLNVIRYIYQLNRNFSGYFGL
jgi:hypothetical protein